MLENEVETGQESGGETTVTEQQPPAEQAVKKPKAASAAEEEPQAPVKKAGKAKKTAAVDEIMAPIKNMTVLELAELVKVLEKKSNGERR